ncbi:hypothetical protein TSAR_005264 [Trichomalopsis sarcophagae]|uniref:TNFR-Cys domain-containing protein n=1 Tax=Trichomalopsis sarcophagae TaxID=543379 RepID=A0A232FFN5_9HYME|nr:hypothetical protein TSAR_005264 [Trichomalopsis sarcophagae]
MAIGRISALLILVVFAAVCLVQPWKARAGQKKSEARAHLRHHRGDSHCSRCGPGWGVVERCGRGRDTVCAECQPGTYSPHHGTQPCWICSRCGPGLYEARRCSASTDTVCDSCHRRAPDNPDYLRKCGQEPSVFLAPEDARSTGEQSDLVNEDPLADSEERERVLWQDAQAQMGDDEAHNNDVRLQD